MKEDNIQAQLAKVNKAFDHKEKSDADGKNHGGSSLKSLQLIIYGAPGTGKSWGIDDLLKSDSDRVFRTTFHPDSDYSTFVGAYKPTMVNCRKKILSLAKLGVVLQNLKDRGETRPEQKLGAEYWESFEDLTPADVKSILDDDSMYSEVTKGVAVGEYLARINKQQSISYAFVPQAFTNAYVKAWKAWATAGGVGGSDPAQPKEAKGIDKVMVDAVSALITEKSAGCEVSTGDIINKFIAISGGKYAEGSAIPTDYCYNRVNAGTALDKPKLFEYISYGKFKCLGEGANYTGDIFSRPAGATADKVVGKCENGNRTLSGGVAPIYLVIEEINRGNCAQVFGDIFQLLDRKDGYSQYPIKADEDLRKFLAEEFHDLDLGAKYAKVQSGEELILPNNLCIWATMNTSDQSLFPMDSAFKRRWDWEYKPIKNEGKDWKIKVGTDEYDWWAFLGEINNEIADYTSSEDKQLGYFFLKPKDGGDVIDTESFVSKVIFYLWKDVFKDDLPQTKPFKYTFKEGESEREREIRFTDFYQDGLKDKLVAHFLENLGLKKIGSGAEAAGTDNTASNGTVS